MFWNIKNTYEQKWCSSTLSLASHLLIYSFIMSSSKIKSFLPFIFNDSLCFMSCKLKSRELYLKKVTNCPETQIFTLKLKKNGYFVKHNSFKKKKYLRGKFKLYLFHFLLYAYMHMLYICNFVQLLKFLKLCYLLN